MIESILQQRSVRARTRITVKTVLAAGLVALAVLLPQLVHVALGAPGGVRWLPMYLPVLLAGCLLGPVWGLGVGVLSPLCSFALTSLWGGCDARRRPPAVHGRRARRVCGGVRRIL